MIVCKKCTRKGYIAGQAFNQYRCYLCGKFRNHANTATSAYCPECAKKENMCQRCGEDLLLGGIRLFNQTKKIGGIPIFKLVRNDKAFIYTFTIHKNGKYSWHRIENKTYISRVGEVRLSLISLKDEWGRSKKISDSDKYNYIILNEKLYEELKQKILDARLIEEI